MTESEGSQLKMWQPVVTPGGPGLAQEWLIVRTGERLLRVSHQAPKGFIFREYPIEQVQLQEAS